MSQQNPFRTEIEQILLSHPRTRAAKVLAGMKRNLTNAEMSQEASAAGQPCSADSIAYVRKTVHITLDDGLVSAPSDAEWQANLYRELLNYHCSPDLRQHIMARLTRLQQMDSNVKMTPLEDVYLGAKGVRRPEKSETPCPDCWEVHAGECP